MKRALLAFLPLALARGDGLKHALKQALHRAHSCQSQRELKSTAFFSSSFFFIFLLLNVSVLIKGEVVPTGSQQTTESETPVPAATDTADPLLYPSWYKGQTRKATTNPPSTPVSEGLGHIGPPDSEDSNVQKAEGAEAAASERAAVSGKATSSPAATSQVSVHALVSECFPVPPRVLLERRASKGADRNCGLGKISGTAQPQCWLIV